jgi:hypothetical protein
VPEGSAAIATAAMQASAAAVRLDLAKAEIGIGIILEWVTSFSTRARRAEYHIGARPSVPTIMSREGA